MADFRKWFLVLAVLALVAVPASAQPFTCVTNPGQPLIIRDGGLTELVGDVVLNCHDGVAATTQLINFQITMTPTDVSNRVQSGGTVNGTSECPTGIACVTDSLLIVKDISGNPFVIAGVTVAPVVGLLQSNLVGGDVPNTRNSILFPSVVLPQGTTSIVRFTNVRVVAPPASIGGTTFVFENVTTNPFGAVPITNPSQTVAQVLPAMQFVTRTCTDAAGAVTTFQQCIAQPRPGADSITFNVKFTEGFAGAFKVRGTTAQTVIGAVYGTESGLTLNATSIGGVGWLPAGYADSGTQLIVRFTNIPNGVNLFATTTETVNGTTGPFVANRSQSLGGDITTSGTTGSSVTLTCGASSYASRAVTLTGGAGSATWQVTTAPAGQIQRSVSFGISVQYTPDTTNLLPALTGSTPGSVSGNLAPISSIDFASTSAPVPRFRDNPTGAQVFAIVPCVTNLLFPFITNQGGFDTGIALVNTSLDTGVFNTPTQTGKCTVFYYNGTATAPAPQTTADVIKPGAHVAYTLQSGGLPGSTSSTQGFQGYAIARCSFQYGHGYAFISDRNTPSLGSQGYLALVIPDRTGNVRPPSGVGFAPDGSGEQLAN